MGKPRVMQQTTFKNFPTFDSAFGNDFIVLSTFVPTDTLEHLKYCGKNTKKPTDAVAKFTSSKGIRMLSFLVDDVIYLRTLYWASYRKSDKHIILHELAYPRLRDDYVGMVFHLPQTIRFVSEPGIRNFRPTIVSSNLIRTIRIRDHFPKIEQQDLLFENFISIFQPILGINYAILIVLDLTAWDRHLSSLDVGGTAGFKKPLCHDWLMLYNPLSPYSPFSRFGGTATVISRFNVLVSGYVIQFPDYHHHTAATTTFSGGANFVTLGS